MFTSEDLLVEFEVWKDPYGKFLRTAVTLRFGNGGDLLLEKSTMVQAKRKSMFAFNKNYVVSFALIKMNVSHTLHRDSKYSEVNQ